jgi:hypothetical protein
MQHINPDHKPILRRRSANPATKREQMTDQQRYDYALRAMKKNKLQRQFADAVIDGDQEQQIDLAQRRKELEMEKVASNLAQMRFPKSVFDRWCSEQPPRAAIEPDVLIWSCTECKITVMPAVVSHGYIRGNCLCQKRETDNRLQKESAIRDEELRRQLMIDMFKRVGRYAWLAPQYHLEYNTFDNFDLDRVKPAYRDDVEFALNYARHFADEPMSNTIAYGRGKSGLYANAIDLFAVLDSMRLNDTDPMDMENKMKWCDLLVIDEIDRVKLTDTRFGFYYRVLNYRSQKEMANPGSAPTILICNATISDTNAAYDLEKYIGTPSASRIQVGLHPIFIPGDDQRASSKED